MIPKYVCGIGDILTADYISRYLGVATVSVSSTRKEAGFDGTLTYGVENISSNKRNLMNPDELLKMEHDKEIVMVRGRKPFICKKFDYSQHLEADKLKDMTLEEQREIFKESIEQNSKKIKLEKKIKYSFKDF